MKYGFKTLAAALAIGLATAFVASDANADAKYKVAYIARSQRDSFAAWLANSIVKEAQKYPDMTLTVFDGQSKNEVMQQLIENAVQSKYDLRYSSTPRSAGSARADSRRPSEQGMQFVATNPKFDDETIPYVDANPYQQGGENAKLGSHTGSEECAGRRADGTARQSALGGPPDGVAEGVLRQAGRRQAPRHADRQLEQGRGDASYGGLDPGASADRRGHLDERQHGGRRDRGDQGRRRQDPPVGLWRRRHGGSLPSHQGRHDGLDDVAERQRPRSEGRSRWRTTSSPARIPIRIR